MTAKVPLYPFLLNPTLHVTVWGGRKLQSVYQKNLPTDEPYGESWELYDTSTVANGPLAGQTLGEVLAEYGPDLIGPKNDPAEGFPLLAKLIEAQQWLSIQVHPNDAQAQRLDGKPRGKTEAWYILATEPGAQLAIAIQPGTTRDQMAQAIRNNTLEDLVVYADVVPGDVLFIPAGTVHAIGPGVMLYEIQQACELTYRLYDWGRMGLDGKPRPLHIEKGVEVSHLDSVPEIKHTGSDTSAVVCLVSCPFFETLLYRLDGETVSLDTQARTFHALTCIEGRAVVTAGDTAPVEIGLGQTVLIPASVGQYSLSGIARVLRAYQPE